MTRLLLVLPDEIRRQSVAVLAHSEGLEVTTASSSLQALTQLERNTPDVIICDGHPGDLSAMEFHEIIRSETSTERTPLLLVADTPPSWLDRRLDVYVSRNSTSRELVSIMMETALRPTHNPLQLQPLQAAPDAAQIRGTLEIMTLFDLLISFNQMRKTGRIVLKGGDTETLIYLKAGEVRHVEHGASNGKAALEQAIAETDRAPTSSFGFAMNSEALVTDLPLTIPCTTSQLLLEIAVHLDHVRSSQQSART